MKTPIKYIFIAIATVLSISACQEDPKPGGTATQDASGEWYVKYYLADGSGGLDAITGYTTLMTFNAASNNGDSLWVTDTPPSGVNGSFWTFKVKAGFDAGSKSFAVDQAVSTAIFGEDPYPVGVTIVNGKVLPGQGKSSTGVETDSIYFEISFSDDSTPYGTTYIGAGHRRTGFLEDEH